MTGGRKGRTVRRKSAIARGNANTERADKRPQSNASGRTSLPRRALFREFPDVPRFIPAGILGALLLLGREFSRLFFRTHQSAMDDGRCGVLDVINLRVILAHTSYMVRESLLKESATL